MKKAKIKKKFKTLDELTVWMNSETDETVDYSDLPTYGGPAPADTSEVWSWDEGRLLVGVCAPFDLVSRSDYNN